MSYKVILSLLFVCFLFGGCASDWRKAEASAREYASKVPNATGDVSCTRQDTDGDGYCGCTIFMKSGTERKVECGCEDFCLLCAEGCKPVDSVKIIGSGSSRSRRLRF
jgi:hypothetical protein